MTLMFLNTDRARRKAAIDTFSLEVEQEIGKVVKLKCPSSRYHFFVQATVARLPKLKTNPLAAQCYYRIMYICL